MTLSRLASVLAVLATLGVLGTTVAAVAAYTHRDAGVADAGPVEGAGRSHAFAGGRLVVDRGGDAAFEVPGRSRGWTTERRGVVVYYVDRTGSPAVGVEGPAVFRDRYCALEPGSSNRGFAGFTRSVAGRDARVANVALSREWVRGVALAEDLRTSSPHTPLRTDEIRLADGSTAVRSRSRIAVAGLGPCGAPSVVFTMVSLDTGAGVANLVLVRDAGVPGALSGAAADRILGTLRARG